MSVPPALTPAETHLADELVRLVDYTGRILSGTAGPHYIGDKARELERVAADLAERAGQAEAAGARMGAVRAAVAERSQRHVVGRLLFPRPDARGGGT